MGLIIIALYGGFALYKGKSDPSFGVPGVGMPGLTLRLPYAAPGCIDYFGAASVYLVPSTKKSWLGCQDQEEK